MSFLDGILGNKALVDLALGKFKKIMRENGSNACILTFDSTSDNIDVNFSAQNMAIIPGDELAKYQAGYLRLLQLEDQLKPHELQPSGDNA